jgi:hypothetical protein
MDYPGLVKSLDLPAGYSPPTELAHADIRARAIGRAFTYAGYDSGSEYPDAAVPGA